MSLHIIYGINAAGKDTVANEVIKHYKDAIITSESRILMYHLGLVNSVDATVKIDKEIYKKLENAKREDIQKIYKVDYPQTMRDLTTKHELVLLLSHLVFALYIDKSETKYVTDIQIPGWLIDLSDGMIQLTANPYHILQRRVNDLKKSSRDRVIQINQIIEHQELCNEKWEKIKMEYPNIRMKIINNDEGRIEKAAQEIIKFINSQTNEK